METWRARLGQAAALHRRATATAAAAAVVLDATRPVPADQREQHELAERLRVAASALTPGWLGAPLDAQSADTPLGGPGLPAFVRIGTAQPLDDARFPAVVPLLGTGHLTLDADSRDARVAGLLRSVLIRLLAAAPPGALLVRAVDAATAGELFAPFAPLTDAGLMAPPATDQTGLRALLTEAEQWVRPSRRAARHNRHDRTLLLVIGTLPELTEAVDLTRIGALARHGPEAGLHLIVAGWPPPPLTDETAQPPLPRATMVALRNPYALVGDPPGGTFGSPVPYRSGTGLNAPVFLDEPPPLALLDRVCRELAARFRADYRRTLDDLLPDPATGWWTESAADGLTAVVGHDGERSVTLTFDERSPHWLICGRPGAGRSSFLANVLYGLATRYHPDELALHLVSFAEGASFTEFTEFTEPIEAAGSTTPTESASTESASTESTARPGGAAPASDAPWLPHLRRVAAPVDRAYGLDVLRELDAELDRRAGTAEPTSATGPLPRIVCVLDEFPVLISGDDPVRAEALRRLESLARRGRAHGVHLILSSRPTPELAALRDRRDSFLAQFPVRVALPGGADVLEPTNDAAAGLPLGTAVVNTAGGLGGPRGATRGHERVIRFPDPGIAVDPRLAGTALATLRQRLWADRPAGATAPEVVTGSPTGSTADSPTAGSDSPTAGSDSLAAGTADSPTAGANGSATAGTGAEVPPAPRTSAERGVPAGADSQGAGS